MWNLKNLSNKGLNIDAENIPSLNLKVWVSLRDEEKIL